MSANPKIVTTSPYFQAVERFATLRGSKSDTWNGINAESAARMALQNRFKTGLDIARYTAEIMRKDMADYDANPADYTQSLGCWHGFTAQQLAMAVKRHRGTMDKSYIYLSGWMVAALRSEFGPLPDQSMHEKTTVSDLIEEIYTFLKQADARPQSKGSSFSECSQGRDDSTHWWQLPKVPSEDYVDASKGSTMRPTST